MSRTLVARLGIEEGDVVAFVGGGGKSTLVLGIGRELASADRPVVMATTTKMGIDQVPGWAVVCHNATEATNSLEAGRPVYLLREAAGAKVIGVDPTLVNDLAANTKATFLIEADGSRGRPFKAPGPHEPVIPASATLVVVVVGIDAIGHPIAEVCHRPERVAVLTGRALTDLVRPEDVAAVATDPAGGRQHVPPGARHIVALTKVAPEHRDLVEQVAARVPRQTTVVVIDSMNAQR